VAKADTKLFNKASQVALVRLDDKTVMTMANDFRGNPKEFAIVIPVPTFLERDQIHVGDKALLDHLDAYSAPRLVEYFDGDPCVRQDYDRAMPMAVGAAAAKMAREKSLGVTVEARYTIGEYDILILSARESTGLGTWLTQNGYRIPPGASAVLGSYIKQGMRFFVAKVNLKEQAKLGFQYLRPLQVAYESPKFMLPIRLGTVNADGPQELFVYALTQKGRVETTNYRTVRLPSGMDLPVYVKSKFPDFYKAMFAEQVRREDMRSVFLEYAWDMAWCDPCAADPLSRDELRQLRRLLARRSSAGAAGPGPAGLPHPPPRPLRRGPFSRGPRLPGDRRSPELPGALRAAPSLEGSQELSRRGPVPEGPGPPAGGRGAGARHAHRLAHRRHPPPHGRHRARREEVVAEGLGRLSGRGDAMPQGRGEGDGLAGGVGVASGAGDSRGIGLRGNIASRIAAV
jgi:uncharacterized protein DUF2330